MPPPTYGPRPKRGRLLPRDQGQALLQRPHLEFCLVTTPAPKYCPEPGLTSLSSSFLPLDSSTGLVPLPRLDREEYREWEMIHFPWKPRETIEQRYLPFPELLPPTEALCVVVRDPAVLIHQPTTCVALDNCSGPVSSSVGGANNVPPSQGRGEG